RATCGRRKDWSRRRRRWPRGSGCGPSGSTCWSSPGCWRGWNGICISGGGSVNMLAFQLELTHPLLLAGLLLLPGVGYYFYPTLVDFARWQQKLSLAARSLIVALLILALSGLTVLEPTHEQFVIFAVDRSLSVGEESRREADDFLDRALPHKGNNRVAFLQ